MGKFVVKTVNSGFKFDLKAGNGETIVTSEVYTAKNSCLSGVKSVARYAPIAALEDQTEENYAKQKHPKFEVYQDKAKEYRFRLKATNGLVIAVSEGYVTKRGCLYGIKNVKRYAADAEIAYEDA